MHFITTLAFVRRSDIAIDLQARMSVVVSSMVLAPRAIWYLLKAGWVWAVTESPSAMRWVLRGVLPSGAGQCRFGAGGLYLFFRRTAFASALDSISLIVAVTIALGMLERWFMLGKQNLALRKFR